MDGPLIRHFQSIDESPQRPIGNQDLAVLVGQADAVDGRIDQPAEEHRVPFELLLRSLQLRDVDDEALTMETFAVVDQGRRVADPGDPAVWADQPVLTREGRTRGHRLRIGGEHLLSILIVQDLPPEALRGKPRRGRIPDDRLDLWPYVGQPLVLRLDIDGKGKSLDQQPKLDFARM